jgi:hypothetical protein
MTFDPYKASPGIPADRRSPTNHVVKRSAPGSGKNRRRRRAGGGLWRPGRLGLSLARGIADAEAGRPRRQPYRPALRARDTEPHRGF